LRPEAEGAVPARSITAANPPFVRPGTAALPSGADACALVALRHCDVPSDGRDALL
jgi:hypothetical protein